MMIKAWRVLAGIAAAFMVAGSAFAQTVTELQNNQVVSISGAAGQGLIYKIAVPAGQTQFAVGSERGYGECDLYVRFGAAPTLSQFDFRSFRAGNREYVAVANPQAGDWYVMAYARGAFYGAILGIGFQPGTIPGGTGTGGTGTGGTTGTVGRVETPVIDPAGGVYTGMVRVALSSATAGATIRYTVDGSEPTAASPAYAAALNLTTTATVRAKAFKAGMEDSDGATADFTIAVDNSATKLAIGELVRVGAATGQGQLYRVNIPIGQTQLVFTSADGTGEADLYIRYGAAPTLNTYDYRPYRAGNREYIEIPNPQAGDWYVMVYARAAFANVALAAVCSPGVPVTPRVATPLFSPAGGSFVSSINVAISCATAGATIRYTTDGSEPTANSAEYTAALTFTASTTLRAKAFLAGIDDSYPATAAFTLTTGATGGGGTTVIPSGGSGLGAFVWAGRKLADPQGIPGGARYGEGVESGLRYCQWSWSGLILHACFSASATAVNGNGARWYHFTTNGRVYPSLAGYRWTLTSSARQGTVTWYRWKRY